MSKPLQLKAIAVTEQGSCKDRNEDSIFIETGEFKKWKFGIFAVADGVGGSQCGLEASQRAVRDLKNWVTSLPAMLEQGKSFDEIKKHLRTEAELLNLNILEEGKHYGKTMATTLSLLFTLNNKGFLLHLGDSRIYRIRSGKAELLTEDHTWVALQIKKGKLTHEQAKTHKNRHAVTRCLGKSEISSFFEHELELKGKDIFLLCTDGFYEYFSLEALAERFQNKCTEEDYPSVLQGMVAEIYQKGAKDNLSAIVVKGEKCGLKKICFFPWL